MLSHRNEHRDSTRAIVSLRAPRLSASSPTVVPARTVTCSDSAPAASRAAAKYRTTMWTWPIICAAPSAADRTHRPVRLDEIGAVDPVARRFAPHRASPRALDRRVVGAAAQQPPQIGLVVGEQTTTQLPVGGQPRAVTAPAERLRHRGDHPDLPGAARHGITDP